MLSIGIVGLPNVGKSTLFNALTKKKVPIENFPFCTIDPSVGIVSVPDERLNKIASISKSEKIIPTAIEFIDIAGLIKGAAEGEGLGNQFLSNIREADAIAQVVRIFEDENIIHVSGKVSPLDDIETIGLELIMADLQTVSKKLLNYEKDVKKGNKEIIKEVDILNRVKTLLEKGKFANSLQLSEDEKKILKTSHLLTSKPILYILNKKYGSKNLDELYDYRWKNLIKFFQENNLNWVCVDAKTESELTDLIEEEKNQYKNELSIPDDGLDNLIKESYKMLNLITFFTSGEKETRAWTIEKGDSAPEAGSKIHSDFKDKFIKASVISYKDLIDSGSWKTAKERGLIRTEGKDYIVKDGDIIEFKI